MMYSTSNKPRQISLDFMDSVISHAVKFLDIKNVEIEIDFKKLGNIAANVDFDEDENLVEICVNENLWRKEEEFERTIFHELVHVKQMIDGRLDNSYPSKWCGIIYTCAYYDLPWEKEAYALEEKMMQSFKR